jgi:hypothetical protein
MQEVNLPNVFDFLVFRDVTDFAFQLGLDLVATARAEEVNIL